MSSNSHTSIFSSSLPSRGRIINRSSSLSPSVSSSSSVSSVSSPPSPSSSSRTLSSISISWKDVFTMGAIALFSVVGVYGIYRYFRKSPPPPPPRPTPHNPSPIIRSKLREREERKKLFLSDCRLLLERGVIVSSPELLFAKRERFIAAGKDKLSIITDFDRTLTRYRNDSGHQTLTSKSIIDSSNALPDEYRRRMDELCEKYYPLEKSPEVPMDIKKKYMKEWWIKAQELLCEYPLKRDTIIQAVNEAVTHGKIIFRDEIHQFFHLLHNESIPLFIISASIADVIEETMRQSDLPLPGSAASESVSGPAPLTFLFANRLKYNNTTSIITSFSPMIYHSLNRSYRDSVLRNKSEGLRSAIKDRTKLILLGDQIHDALILADGAMEGGVVDEIIRIGFFNDNVNEENAEIVERYMNVYDIVLTGDPSFAFVNEFIQSIFEQNND